MKQPRNLRPLIKNVRIVSRAALRPGELSDCPDIVEARRYLEALNGLEVVEAIIDLRTRSPGGGFPDIWA